MACVCMFSEECSRRVWVFFKLQRNKCVCVRASMKMGGSSKRGNYCIYTNVGVICVCALPNLRIISSRWVSHCYMFGHVHTRFRLLCLAASWFCGQGKKSCVLETFLTCCCRRCDFLIEFFSLSSKTIGEMFNHFCALVCVCLYARCLFK